jgi:FtsP/CotA-like multicopper oxidase with cupredoxin domain
MAEGRSVSGSPDRVRVVAGVVAVNALVVGAVSLTGCPRPEPAVEPILGAVDAGAPATSSPRAVLRTALVELNEGPCRKDQAYEQKLLLYPAKFEAVDGVLETELVVAFRKRCVPVWNAQTQKWEMQTLNLRTYGFPRHPDVAITPADADDPNSQKIAWSAPGPTFVVHPATQPGASDGTRIKLRLFNRMPYEGGFHECLKNVKCNPVNDAGAPSGVDPATGMCREPLEPALGAFLPETPRQAVGGQVIEPPNCFHGPNATNFHFHGFHVSPQLGQDNVGLELRPPKPPEEPVDIHGAHGAGSTVAYGHFDFALDPLRYTQAPGTHWYHAHKHGATALHVLNGQVGTFEVRGSFDRLLDDYFRTKKGGGQPACDPGTPDCDRYVRDQLMVVQQLQEKQPGLGGADQTNAVLVNGQGNPIVQMRPGEIQRWRFVGATMQASAALRIGFPLGDKKGPEVRQIAMDGVQFSQDNYSCQPFLNRPDCAKKKSDPAEGFDATTAFDLWPGNRVDLLIKAPDTPGVHCLMLKVESKLAALNKAVEQHVARATILKGTCGLAGTPPLGPLLTLEVTKEAPLPMSFPNKEEFPLMPKFLHAIAAPAKTREIRYAMVGQGTLHDEVTGGAPQSGTQFWINQQKYDGDCANETVTIDVPERWVLRNNSNNIKHPFHIHQNPFQLLVQSDVTYPDGPKKGQPIPYMYPPWRDVMPIPAAPDSSNPAPDSDPDDPKAPWGRAEIVYVAKEFTGGYVNHCHILGHEDRGMMHNTQAVCATGEYARTSPVTDPATCDVNGFCPSDCQSEKFYPATKACAPPPRDAGWPGAYGYPYDGGPGGGKKPGGARTGTKAGGGKGQGKKP